MQLLDIYKNCLSASKSFLRHLTKYGPKDLVPRQHEIIERHKQIVRRNTPARPGKRANAIPKRQRRNFGA